MTGPEDYPGWTFTFGSGAETYTKDLGGDLFAFQRLLYTIRAEKGEQRLFFTDSDFARAWERVEKALRAVDPR